MEGASSRDFLNFVVSNQKIKNMSKFIYVELTEAKDPNGMTHINAENINWIAKSGKNAKLKMNSGDIFTLKVPSY